MAGAKVTLCNGDLTVVTSPVMVADTGVVSNLIL